MPVKTSNGDVYSIDKLVLDFRLKVRSGGEWAEDFLFFLSFDMFTYFKNWSTNKIGSYKEQFTFDCGDGNSFWAGVGLNDGTGKVVNRVRLEFNPNKVAQNYVFVRVFNRLLVLSSRPPQVVRFDLAVDFPVLRSDCFLIKDQRLYEEYRKSTEDRTQYLGSRNKAGRCKLYNKALEAGLGYPMSRLELTIGGDSMSYEDVLAIWPKVLIWDDLQMAFDGEKLTDTDRFIIKSLIMHPDRIYELSYYMKKRIERTMIRYTRFLQLDETIYQRIISQLYIYSQLLDFDFALDPFSGLRIRVDNLST